MRKQLFNFCLSSLLILISAGQATTAAENPRNKRILIVYGNQDIGEFKQTFNRIVVNDLADRTGIPVMPEFLDLVNRSDEEQKRVAESLRLKYADLEFALLIGVLPEGNTFIQRWGDLIAPESKPLYILPGPDVVERLSQVESAAILNSTARETTINTLQLMPRLLPKLEHIYIVGGAGVGDRSYLSRIENVIKDIDFQISTTYLTGLPPEELIETLGQDPGNSALLMGTYNTDRRQQAHGTVEISKLISEQTKIPVFGIFEALLGNGALGGNVSFSAAYADQTIELATAMLAQEPRYEVTGPTTSFVFDANQLERFDIDPQTLPAGSILLNVEPPFYVEYSSTVISSALLLLVLLILIAALFRELNHRRKAELELRKVHKMEALGSLAGGIAHDFNNILMAIVGNAEIAKLTPNEPDKVSEQLSKILTASERAKSLITQILMFSRESEDEIFDTVNVKQLLEEMAGQVRASCPEGIEVKVTNPSGLWDAYANATQIHQVLMNLCVNAQYAMKSGTVEIRAENICNPGPLNLFNQTMPAGDYVAFSVADSGSGISRKNLSRVFEPFFSTKPQGKGTGLGLSLVYGIVKGHGGYLNIHSIEGKGTTITVYLKASYDNTTNQTRINNEGHVSGKGQLILLVDDDEMVAEANKRILEYLGYKAQVYNNPVIGLRHFQELPANYDLVISDFSMPEMNGITLISKIRETHDSIPCILCTGYLDAINTEEVDHLVNFSVLNKPSSLNEMSNAIDKAFITSTSAQQ